MLALAFLLELVLKHVHRRHRADGHLQVYRYCWSHMSLNILMLFQVITQTGCVIQLLSTGFAAARLAIDMLLGLSLQAHQGACAVSFPHQRGHDRGLHAGQRLAEAAPLVGAAVAAAGGHRLRAGESRCTEDSPRQAHRSCAR